VYLRSAGTFIAVIRDYPDFSGSPPSPRLLGDFSLVPGVDPG
jgi:hypothetical protein